MTTPRTNQGRTQRAVTICDAVLAKRLPLSRGMLPPGLAVSALAHLQHSTREMAIDPRGLVVRARTRDGVDAHLSCRDSCSTRSPSAAYIRRVRINSCRKSS